MILVASRKRRILRNNKNKQVTLSEKKNFPFDGR